MKQMTLLAITLLNVNLAFAASPWLAAPQSFSASLSQISQSDDEYWRGRDKTTLKGGKLSLDTTWLNLSYGISDNLSTDLRVGYAQSDYKPLGSENGRTDSLIGVNWRFKDEYIHKGIPSIALRLAATVAGDYETDQVNSIGDGASGVESSLLLGKILSPSIALAGEGGYRFRNNDVPNEMFINLASYFKIVQGLNVNVAYHVIESFGEVDISDADFLPKRNFSTLAESRQTAILGISYQFLKKFNVAANYAKVVKGRNTSKTDIFGLTLSAAF